MTEQSRIITEEQWQEYLKLQKQLQIAMEALYDFTDESEMEDVRERANIAVKAIKKVEKGKV